MAKKITVCAPPPEQYRDAYTRIFARIYIEHLYAEGYTYDQIARAIEYCEGELKKQKTL